MTFLDGDFFESQADFSYGDMYSPNFLNPDYGNVSKVFETFEQPIFFIETHRLPLLLRQVSKFDKLCKIIAHNSDFTFGGEILNFIPDNVTKIWCQNYNYIETEKIQSLPIGLERKRWVPEQRKQELLREIMDKDIDRDQMVYMNFDVKTNPYRKVIYDSLKDKPFINTEMKGWSGGDYENYLINLKRHKYVISPPGNGIDCHRNWEALYCGCIPIVLDSYFVRNVFGENVLNIRDFGELDLWNLKKPTTQTNFEDIINKILNFKYEKNQL